MDSDGFFDVSEILRCGVYALLYRGVVVYVGQSRRMLTRVYTHRNLWGKKRVPEVIAKARGINFDEVWVRPCRPDLLDELEKELIQKYRPRHNVHFKAGAEMPKAIREMIRLAAPVGSQVINRRGL